MVADWLAACSHIDSALIWWHAGSGNKRGAERRSANQALGRLMEKR